MVVSVTVSPPAPVTIAKSNQVSFVQRKLSVTFQLNTQSGDPPNVFSQSLTGTNNLNQVTLSNLRMSARISKAGGRSMGRANLVIYGMTQSLMKNLATLGNRLQLVPKNNVIVSAGDDTSGMATVFQGSVINAWGDYNNPPTVPFYVEAMAGMPQAVISAPPLSFKGQVDIATVMNGLATQMSLGFENNGIVGTLNNPNYGGTAKEQAFQIAKDYNFEVTIDQGNTNNNGTLIIWPHNGVRNGQTAVISPETGMIGYPTFNAFGIALRTLFNPTVGLGGSIKVQSSLEATNNGIATPASGIWSVYGLDHDLEAQTPSGKWESQVLAYNPNFTNPPLVK